MGEFLSRLNQPLLNRIIELLPGEIPVYLVGGAIRDALLNRTNIDLDFVTPGDSFRLARRVADGLGAAFFPLDEKRGVARIVTRADVENKPYGQTATKIDFSKFQGRNLLEDLEGRDFTINAMALDIRDLGGLIDPLGGAVDLLARKLKACSDTSLVDDPVRILRSVRFSVGLKLRIDKDTLQHIKGAVGKITEVSSERIRDELFRMLLQENARSSMRILDQLGALEQVLPELTVLKGIEQSSPHIMDAWEHTLDILAKLEELMALLAVEFNTEKSGNLVIGLAAVRLGRFRKDLITHFETGLNPDRPHRGLLFLAALYYDAGKARTRSIEDSGKVRFLEHEQVGSRIVQKRGRALKLSNPEVDRLVSIVGNHMRPALLSHENVMPTQRAIYRFFRDTGAGGIDICILSLADLLATYGPTLPQDRWEKHLDVVRILLSAWFETRESNILPSPIINGDDLLKELDLSPGPVIGYLLESIREAQVAGEVHTQEEAITLAGKLLADK